MRLWFALVVRREHRRDADGAVGQPRAAAPTALSP